MDFEKLIQEKWTSPLRKGYIYENGFFMTKRYEDLKDEYYNFEVEDDDIWVCTFPKCGTTWTQEMVWLISHNLDFKTAKEKLLDERFPFLELPIVFDFRDEMKKDPNFVAPDRINDTKNLIRVQKPPVCIKTHLPWQLFPKLIKNGTRKPKIIYVVRDPKDVCVSFYHHTVILDNTTLTFDEYCELFMAGKVLWGPFWDHVLPFWKMRNQPNILFIKYEDMKRDLKSVIRKVAKFLDRFLSEEQIEKLNNHLSFDSMKNNPAVNKNDLVDFVKKVYKREPGGQFMRKGIVGDHKSAFSPEMLKKFEAWIQRNLEGTDYEYNM